MTIDLGSKDMANLMQLRQNDESAGKQRDPCYRAIIAKIDRRREGTFSVEKTVSFLQIRARVRTFVRYKSIADLDGTEWRIARPPIAPHLDDVCRAAYGKGWPQEAVFAWAQSEEVS